MRAAARRARAAAARPAGWGEDPPTADPAATVRWCAPAPARAPSATSRKTADCASAWPRRGLGRRGFRRRVAARRSRGGLILPWRWRWRRRSCGGLGAGGTLGGLLVANGKPPSPARLAREARRQHRPHRDFAARLRHAGAEPPRDVLQFPDRHPEPKHDRAGANPDHAGQNQRIADTEFLDRDSVADRQQARQNKANTGDQHANHHRTNPPAAPEMLADRQCHDTVIMCASPTGNSAQGSSKISSRRQDFPRNQRRLIQPAFSPARISTAYQLLPICCVASGN